MTTILRMDIIFEVRCEIITMIWKLDILDYLIKMSTEISVEFPLNHQQTQNLQFHIKTYIPTITVLLSN